MSVECEEDKCDFCHEVKVVERTYLYPSKHIKPESPEEYLRLYNEGSYFISVKTCSDCGVPKTTKQYTMEKFLGLINDFEKRNNISIYVEIHADGSSCVLEFWRDEKLTSAHSTEELYKFLLETSYVLDENGICNFPATLITK